MFFSVRGRTNLESLYKLLSLLEKILVIIKKVDEY
jgi:hypothetical protein